MERCTVSSFMCSFFMPLWNSSPLLLQGSNFAKNLWLDFGIYLSALESFCSLSNYTHLLLLLLRLPISLFMTLFDYLDRKTNHTIFWHRLQRQISLFGSNRANLSNCLWLIIEIHDCIFFWTQRIRDILVEPNHFIRAYKCQFYFQ